MCRLAGIRQGDPPYLIAEIGTAHWGSVPLACELVDMVAESGWQAAKFQMYVVGDFLSPGNPIAKHYSNCEFTATEWTWIRRHCNDVGVEFVASVFSPCLYEFYEKLEPAALKVASSEARFGRCMDWAQQVDMPVLISTGMLDEDEIRRLLYLDIDDLTLMHCVSLYPHRAEASLVGWITRLNLIYGVAVGYSDHTAHTDGALAASLAVWQGAPVIEKHIVPGYDVAGPDSECALDYAGMLAYRQAVDTAYLLATQEAYQRSGMEMAQREATERTKERGWRRP